jgi:hypothetical protein
MKKICNIILVLALALGVALVNAPKAVEAIPSPIPNGVADGSWTTGSEVNVDLAAATAPSWLQLLSEGTVITAPVKICHPFRGGQFGWTGQIMQLVGDQWVKLTTTAEWVPDSEGEFMACAETPAAGTFALFGYYTEPAMKECSWNYGRSGMGYGLLGGGPGYFDFGADVPDTIPEFTVVRYNIYDVSPKGSITSGLSGTGTVEIAPWGFIVYFGDGVGYEGGIPSFKVHMTFPTLNCYKDLDFTNIY